MRGKLRGFIPSGASRLLPLRNKGSLWQRTKTQPRTNRFLCADLFSGKAEIQLGHFLG